MSSTPTWRPPPADAEHHLDASQRDALPDTAYGLPSQRKLPLTDAGHVRAALARFDQVTGASDADRDLAWANIRAAARHFGVEVLETSWQDLGRAPHTPNPARGHSHER